MTISNPSSRIRGPEQSNNDVFLSVRDLRMYYEDNSLLNQSPPVRAVDGVNLDIYEGETLALVGESGSGKTTLGRTILGLNEATGGTVQTDGRDVTELSGVQKRRWQREAGMVFQDPEESLNQRLTVGEIIAEPLEAHDWPTVTAATPNGSVTGDVEPATDRTPDIHVDTAGATLTASVRDRFPLTSEDVTLEADGDTVEVRVEKSQAAMREQRVRSLLDRVGLQEAHFYRYPHQFSGGQRQRVGIARSLALEPRFLVLDEPVSALDVSVQARIINLLEDIQAELGLTYLFIAHDLSVVRHIADRVAVMYLGMIVETGPTGQVFNDPAHPYTLSLLSAIPGSGSPWDGPRITLRGTPPNPRDPPTGCPFATRCPAKIRPDSYDLPEETWRAIDELRVVFRTRARAETGATNRIRSLLDLPVDSAALSETREGVFGDIQLPQGVATVVEEAFDLARMGDDAGAAERLRKAFGSRCDEEHPESRDGLRTNRCLRREPQYENTQSTIAQREGEG